LVNIKASSFNSQTVFIRLNIRPATLKIYQLKLLTISSNSGLRSSPSQHSIVQLLILNEMNSDANIARHLSVGPNVNVQQNLTGFIAFFSSIW